jgi:hypothetical protein
MEDQHSIDVVAVYVTADPVGDVDVWAQVNYGPPYWVFVVLNNGESPTDRGVLRYRCYAKDLNVLADGEANTRFSLDPKERESVRVESPYINVTHTIRFREFEMKGSKPILIDRWYSVQPSDGSSGDTSPKFSQIESPL